MRHIVLDGASVRSRDGLHEMLAARLPLPAWYGRNLDALYDCLTDLGEEVTVLLRNGHQLTAVLGEYGAQTVRVFQDAARGNPRFSFVLL